MRKIRLRSYGFFNYINCLIWTLVIFSLYFQVPYKKLSSLIVVFFGLYMIFNIRQVIYYSLEGKLLKTGVAYLLYISISSIYSIINGQDISRILRFYLILFVIPLCFLLQRKRFDLEYSIFMILSVAKSVYIISIAIKMVIEGTYTPFRQWAQINNYGDAYFVYGFLPRVQIYGNALLVFAFVIRFYKTKKIDICNIILLLGVCTAGNFSFLLGVVVFLAGYFLLSIDPKRIQPWKVMVLIVLVILLSIFSYYAFLEMGRKTDTGNALKIRQIKMLLDTNLLFGKGIASEVEANVLLGRLANANYYEMQTFYIFYQIGAIGIGLFYYITLSLCKKYGNNILGLYIIYLLYTFFNPYCFDTTQMISIVLLINIKGAPGYAKNYCNYNSLLSSQRKRRKYCINSQSGRYDLCSRQQ